MVTGVALGGGRLSARRVVVIDDDPTGGQTVAGVPVVTRWETDDLRWLLAQDREMGFVLTNSRALPGPRAAAVNTAIVQRCLEVADGSGIEVSFVSRSDSTLRGHFRAEVGAICAALAAAGRPADLVLLVPAFFEAGRITHDDQHYVCAGGDEIPVAQTAYARDPAFGFAESDLVEWVRARLGPAGGVVASLSLSRIRTDGVAGVGEVLREVADRTRSGVPPVLVVNATEPADYAVVADAVRAGEAEGLTVVTRSGPSYLSARLGEPLPDAVEAVVPAAGTGTHGLVVVGSHVPLSTAQLEYLTSHLPLPVVELDVPRVLGSERAGQLDALAEVVVAALPRGHVVLVTSRTLHTAADADASLDVAEAVSSALDEVVARVLDIAPPAWIVAKGGITSATMVTRVLQLRHGWIVGQLFRGQLPLWRDDDTTGSKPLCVIFPGNVGDEATLLDVVRTLDHRVETPAR